MQGTSLLVYHLIISLKDFKFFTYIGSGTPISSTLASLKRVEEDEDNVSKPTYHTFETGSRHGNPRPRLDQGQGSSISIGPSVPLPLCKPE